METMESKSIGNETAFWESHIERIRNGDVCAADVLYREMLPLVRKIVLSHCPRWIQPDDLIQTIFSKVFSRLGQFQSTAPFEHWVARISVNTCCDFGRHRSRQRELSMADLAPTDWENAARYDALAPEPEEIDFSEKQRLGSLLEKLPDSDRWVITLLDLEGRSAAEVSVITGWTVTNVRVRVHRARQRLRATYTKSVRNECNVSRRRFVTPNERTIR